MYKTTVKIDGMMCSMCETHIKETIRKTFPSAKKVTASIKKKEATFITDDVIDLSILGDSIERTGYRYLDSETIPYDKKRVFDFWHHR